MWLLRTRLAEHCVLRFHQWKKFWKFSSAVILHTVHLLTMWLFKILYLAEHGFLFFHHTQTSLKARKIFRTIQTQSGNFWNINFIDRHFRFSPFANKLTFENVQLLAENCVLFFHHWHFFHKSALQPFDLVWYKEFTREMTFVLRMCTWQICQPLHLDLRVCVCANVCECVSEYVSVWMCVILVCTWHTHVCVHLCTYMREWNYVSESVFVCQRVCLRARALMGVWVCVCEWERHEEREREREKERKNINVNELSILCWVICVCIYV